MKILHQIHFIIILFLAVSATLTAQEGVNLVTNGSFEEYYQCPTGPGQIQQVIGWNTCRESPDYFNSCTTSSYGVPINSFGNQQAATGNAYVGIICYNNSIFSREIIAGTLINPLSVGQKYFVTFKVNKADDTSVVGYSTNKLGAKLSTVLQSNISVDNAPMFYTNSIISDIGNWTAINGSFVADSAYRYLKIGNFFDDANVTALNNGTGPYAYYYIDDVCLSTDSLLCTNYLTPVGETSFNNRFAFYPNPASEFIMLQSDLQAPYNLEIYNALGQQLYTEQNITANNLRLDINQYNSGILFIKITTKNNQHLYKLLKQ